METKNEVTRGKSKIKVTKNGPYLVTGGIPLSKQEIIADAQGTAYEWREIEKYPLRKNYALCRCGESRKKPFCDGTHVKVNFDGKETASQVPYLDQARKIDGPTLRLTDHEHLCASARFCHRAGGIWTLVPKSDNPEAKRIAIEEAEECPSGRLVAWHKKPQKAIEPEYEQSIWLIEDPQAGVSGPIWARGRIPIESAEGRTYEIRNRVTLCRCGGSSNKPFCDSSHYPEEHKHGGWSDE
jgi:CDGSH-type Zn-finger protein